ncbi:uncharacterized protein CDAR_95701 [Caerostris darwini]|uniref:Uncharacterized protein n=1 Tax=Caerostris darwini TaxID=1538125 RepID=A0AAV4UR51_9ARAC|nr:uncharacterized protein CDAR_95701 [Caerostris darwini]
MVQTQFVLEQLPLNEPVQVLRPYSYGFQFGDGRGMSQYRQESADGTGAVKGSYGYVDPFGVTRNVEYSAGVDGYKAFIKSNEPGLSNHISADAIYQVRPPPPVVAGRSLRPVRVVGASLK